MLHTQLRGKGVSYLASSADGGNNTMCVSPVLALCSSPVPAAALGLWTRRSGSEQDSCVWDHTSLLQRGLTTAQKQPKNRPCNPSPPPRVRAQENPPGLPRPHPNLGIAAAVCASRFQGRPRASPPPPPLCSFSAESFPLPPGTVARLAAQCVCVCVHIRGCTFGSVLRYMPALLCQYCSSRCV